MEKNNLTSYKELSTYYRQRQKKVWRNISKTKKSIYDYRFKDRDIVLFGKETAGVPDYVHNQVIEKITIPMNSKTRSLNLATSVAIVTSTIINSI